MNLDMSEVDERDCPAKEPEGFQDHEFVTLDGQASKVLAKLLMIIPETHI